MASFVGINVLQGSVATYVWCGGIFNIRLTANLERSRPAKKNANRLRFDRIMVMSLWPRFFWPTPCIKRLIMLAASIAGNVKHRSGVSPSVCLFRLTVKVRQRHQYPAQPDYVSSLLSEDRYTVSTAFFSATP